MRHNAFTLVELLVVIGVVSLLISLLLPALNKARETSKTVKCLSNLKQIGIAHMMYIDAHKGYIVLAGYRSDTSSFPSEQGSWATLLVGGKFIQAPNQPDPFSVESSGTSALMCPSGLNIRWGSVTGWNPNHVAPFNDPRVGSHPAAGQFYRSQRVSNGVVDLTVDTHYGINGTSGNGGSVEGFPFSRITYYTTPSPGWGRDSNNTSKRPVNIRITAIPEASKFVQFYDGLFYNFNGSGRSRIAARHNGQKFTNVLFFDGHAETIDRIELPWGNATAPNSQGSSPSTLAKNLENQWPRTRWVVPDMPF